MLLDLLLKFLCKKYLKIEDVFFFSLLFVDHNISLSSLPCSRGNPLKQLFSSSTFLNLFIDLLLFLNNLYLLRFLKPQTLRNPQTITGITQTTINNQDLQKSPPNMFFLSLVIPFFVYGRVFSAKKSRNR